jgi:hypothetical protein
MMRHDYRSFFEGYLHALLSGQAESDRYRLFKEWVASAQFCCQECGREFEVRDQDTDEEDEVLCIRCVQRKAAAGGS